MSRVNAYRPVRAREGVGLVYRRLGRCLAIGIDRAAYETCGARFHPGLLGRCVRGPSLLRCDPRGARAQSGRGRLGRRGCAFRVLQ